MWLKPGSNVLLMVLVQIWLSISGVDGSSINSNSTGRVLSREKRIVYTFNSATGILVALSIPLIVPDRNIFMSYNFEMNYNMPTTATDYSQGPLKRVDQMELYTDAGASLMRRSIAGSSFTRKKAYRTLEINLHKGGFNGKRCVLRAICEASEAPLFEGNGIIGDLLQILLTPSYSEDESLPREFYRAEKAGLQHNCTRYRRHCPQSVLDVISVLG
ncbi:uncharacterized protein LOC129756739 [Uranotaenia lowii]|uniref:uncharacterized protein LOC129756739 n=1 Tax=Uranotaenia lowii TaxID=190385 RepID=UPI0024786903|nr:uncharacterized protein LOC129756739 [Uranotaenia lowii]